MNLSSLEIYKVAVLGAGALGASYASMFFDSGEFSIAFITGGRRYTRLKEEGVIVNGQHYAIPVIHPEEAERPADLIIVALKHQHLSKAIRDLQNLVGEDTVIISVMNGLDSEEMIGEIFGMDKLLYTIAVGIDALRVGNRINYDNPGKILFGEEENIKLSERVRRVQKAFDRAGIIHETPVDMMRVMWWKFMVNVGMNQASAVMRAPYGVFQTSRTAQALMEALMYEVIELAEHAGVDLGEKDIKEWYKTLDTLSLHGKTSMLQDIEANRKTEVEIFGGKVVALGEAYGIATPVNRTLVQIIQVLEEQYQ
jgi:2-dehydropantoate 2-reductase